MRIAGAILAGGAAERLGGRAKGLLRRADGLTILEHLRRELQAAGFGPLALCAGEHNCYADCGMEVVADRVPGRGPLTGIEAALCHYQGTADAVAFAPCDAPRLTRSEFSMLLDAFTSESGSVFAATSDGTWHPLCCIVHIGLLSEVTRALEEQRLSVNRLWRELGAVPVSFTDHARFANINTPEELAHILGGTDESREAEDRAGPDRC